eukprot:ctg_563.g144
MAAVQRGTVRTAWRSMLRATGAPLEGPADYGETDRAESAGAGGGGAQCSRPGHPRPERAAARSQESEKRQARRQPEPGRRQGDRPHHAGPLLCQRAQRHGARDPRHLPQCRLHRGRTASARGHRADPFRRAADRGGRADAARVSPDAAVASPAKPSSATAGGADTDVTTTAAAAASVGDTQQLHERMLRTLEQLLPPL